MPFANLIKYRNPAPKPAPQAVVAGVVASEPAYVVRAMPELDQAQLDFQESITDVHDADPAVLAAATQRMRIKAEEPERASGATDCPVAFRSTSLPGSHLPGPLSATFRSMVGI